MIKCPYNSPATQSVAACDHEGPLSDFTCGKRANECRKCERRVKVFFAEGRVQVQRW